MKSGVLSRVSILFICRISAVNSGPLNNSPGATPTQQLASSTSVLVVTAIDQGSTYTLTYAPSTLTAATTLVAGNATTAVKAGAVVGALAAGSAVAALPLLIPKVIPDVIPEGGEGEGEGEDGDEDCEEDFAKICIDDCTADWFVSNKRVETTSNCAVECAPTIGCSVKDSTHTFFHAITIPSSVQTLTTSAFLGRGSALPLLYAPLQAYLAQEYQRLHIDDDDGENVNSDAACENDRAKGFLDKHSVKNNVAEYCRSQNGFTTSPDYGSLKAYDQVENRLQAVLQVLYIGDRGEGATYTIDEDTDTCNSQFGKILSCGPYQDHTSGGNITDGKGLFSIEPYIYPGTLECAPGGGEYGVQQDEALGNIDSFCTDFDGQKIYQGDILYKIYLQTLGGLLSNISVTWEPDSVGCEEGGDFHDRGYHINKAACKPFLDQTINGCNTETTSFKAAGVVIDQCSRYQLFVKNRENVICGDDPRYSEEARARWKPFDPAVAQSAVVDFCAQNLIADPEVPNTDFSQDGTWPKGLAKGGSGNVTIEVAFPDGACSGEVLPKQAFNTGGDDCARRFKKILDRCDQSGEKRPGGWLIDPGNNGCTQWQIGTIAFPGD